MDLPKDVEDYIKESIDHSLGLSVSAHTLQSKLQAVECAKHRIRDQYFVLLSKLKEKDQVIDRVRAESNMNAQALKKFVEENQKLAAECAHLLSQCDKWKQECSLYDHDREALMDFGNEADQRAKEAEVRVRELEEELRSLSDELLHYKHEDGMFVVESSAAADGTSMEENLLESVLATVVNKDFGMYAYSFLDANSEHESCQSMLKMWNRLKPSTQKVLALVAEVKTLEKDKEHIRINLNKAEDEAKVLFEENKILDEENKRLLRQLHKARSTPESGGKHTSSASVKSNKRKSSAKESSPIERKIDFGDMDSERRPLSPLHYNSPDSRTQ